MILLSLALLLLVSAASIPYEDDLNIPPIDFEKVAFLNTKTDYKPVKPKKRLRQVDPRDEMDLFEHALYSSALTFNTSDQERWPMSGASWASFASVIVMESQDEVKLLDEEVFGSDSLSSCWSTDDEGLMAAMEKKQARQQIRMGMINRLAPGPAILTSFEADKRTSDAPSSTSISLLLAALPILLALF